MNDNTQRYGSILLVAMLVLSMSVAFVGVGAADSTADLNDGDRYWVGQTLEYENTTISGDSDLSITSAEVVTDDTDDSTFVTELNANNGNISIDTSNFESDAYLLEYDYEKSSDDSTGSESVAFEVSEQTLDVEPADVRVDNDGDSETTFEFDSNRNSFEVNVSTDGLTDEELASVFSTGTSYSTSDVEDGNLTVDATDDVDVDFQDIDADSYDFSFEVVDTDASATTSVTVADPGDAVVEFAEPVNSFSEGDSTELTVNFNDTDSADVVIGDEEEVGYELNFTVEDTEENGEVTVVFDSYVAGESDDVVKVHEDSEGDVTVNNRTTLTDRKLAPSEYDMSAFVTSTGDETDVGTLNIVERTSTGVSTVVAPGGETINDYEDIENATESTTVASGDYVAYKVEMTGVYGFLEDGADLSEAEDTPGFYMTIEKDAPNANEEVDLSDADVYTNEDDGVFYVVFDVDNSDFDVDSDYESELVISEDNPYVEEEEDEESHTNTLSTEERDTEFVGYNADDVLEFEEGDELEVTAETNVAEGTESTLTVRMTGDNPTIETYDVVAEDGEFTTTADIEGLSVGTEFTVQLSGETDREDAVIVESTTTDDDDTDTTDDDTDTTDDDTDTNNTDTDTNNTDGDTTEDDTPGFGALVALIAILGAVGLAHRRSD